MPYLVLETAPQFPCDALITYLTAELGAVLTTGPFGDAPNSRGLYDLLSGTSAFDTYEPAICLSARLERHMRLKRFWDNDRQWLVDTNGILSAMMEVPTKESVWMLNGQTGNIRDEMSFVLQANTDILSDFDCLVVPDLTVCIRRSDPEQQQHLEMAIDAWQEIFPDSPVMLVEPDISYQVILQRLGQ